MGKYHLILFIAVMFLVPLINGAMPARTVEGSEKWGYEEVRPKAHMFWWYYKSPQRTEDPNKPWPIILWLQGGPGSSGVGLGNFQEVGPLDTYLKPRNSTWLQKADLLFVDNPVGTGYSFVEDDSVFAKTDEEAAADLITLLISVFNSDEVLQRSPLYVVAESYGGKWAVLVGLAALKAIEAGKLKVKLGGIVLGDTWLSPEDFVFSWAPLLKDVSRLDKKGVEKSNSLTQKIKQQLDDGEYEAATNSYFELEDVIDAHSNSVDFYNFLLDSALDPLDATSVELSQKVKLKRNSRYLASLRSLSGKAGDDLNNLMNVVLREKLKIIPNGVRWGGQAGSVFMALAEEFMKPRINEVDELLAKGVNVTIYSGQVDLICSTKGTEAWVEKLKWEGIYTNFLKHETGLHCTVGVRKIQRGSPSPTKICTSTGCLMLAIMYLWISHVFRSTCLMTLCTIDEE